MRRTGILFLLTLFLLPVAQSVEPPTHFDLKAFSKIPVLEGGRYKPFESFAGKMMETMTGRWTYEKIDPVAYILSMMAFPDEWVKEEIILVDSYLLRETMGLSPDKRYFSFNTIVSNETFQKLFQKVVQKSSSGEELDLMDNNVNQIIHRVSTLQDILSGEEIMLVPPPPGSDTREAWLPLNHPAGYPQEKQMEILENYNLLIASVRNSDNDAFQKVTAALGTQLANLNTEVYPQEYKINRELHYNSFRPFLVSWILFLFAFIVFLVSFYFSDKKIVYIATGMFVTGYVVNTYGFILRSLIAERPPVSNMYESVIFVAWAVLTFALVFEVIYRQKWFLTVASGLGFLLIVMSDLMPFDSNIETLVPVLRSNYWLIIHVMTIVMSYGAFALAMGLAHVVLLQYFRPVQNMALVRTVHNFMYRVLQVGCVLIAAGTILGGVWAAESWGRFWGWDPKETWALISLLGYLAILHARFIGWLKIIGTAVCSIFGFWLIIMTWYGVNFVLGKGLHSYGFGSGGGWYVTAYLILETLFLGAFAVRYYTLNSQVTTPTTA